MNYERINRKRMKDFQDLSSYELYLDKIISDLINAIKPFAEKPSERHNEFTCHVGITTKENCGRCSSAFAAYKAMQQVNEQ